ncbi:MAG: pyridoxamine 5'-phosphate oxidase family protein [Propionicimonas sp.]|uniref:pyridoxamine 5'-phosphate oxidase family protein n=1 Tax=Propionicimonas sp. TaxID=1955623 RepID=UPI003D131AAA
MDSGHFTRLSGDECRQLIRGHSVGRVCWLSGEGLQVLPVTYCVTGEKVLIRVDPESVMGELSGTVRVAFEVDDIDVPTATGWSVLVRGETREYTGRADVVLPEPWAPGSRTLTVAITPITYSGRAVSADHPRS